MATSTCTFLQNKYLELLEKRVPSGGMCVFIQDEQGQVIVAMCESRISTGDFAHFGDLAILHALWFAKDLGLSRIKVEGDNKDL